MIAADSERVIAAARGWLGTPYHDQASVRGVGCDCLGLVRGVWRELHGPEPTPIPPYSRDWGETGTREPLAEAARGVMLELPATEIMPGALILFRMRTGAVAKHCGIASSADRFIHAYERSGVVEVPLDAAWCRRVAFVFLFPNPSSIVVHGPEMRPPMVLRAMASNILAADIAIGDSSAEGCSESAWRQSPALSA